MPLDDLDLGPVDPLEPQADAEMAAALASLRRIRGEFPGDRAAVRAGAVEIGGGEFIVMAGPCAVEGERQVMEIAERAARAGARVLRGGAFKPRTSPYSFQGLGLEGLRLLRKAGDAFGLATISEAMTDSQVPIVAEHVNIIQVGTRSMLNAALLAELARSGRPLLLKRGMTAAVEEWLLAAEALVAAGNPGVILCERGIRTFGRLTRNTCDLAAVPLAHHLTRLPVIVDPSHATGRRGLVPPLCRAAVAIGADGLLVETHARPDEALSDGMQSLALADFEGMMRDLAPWLALWKEARAASERAVEA